MKIKKLIVCKTQPSEEIIRDIIFNLKGLSLIVNNTPEGLIESGSSVGKSTTIKIIDLCLGTKSIRELYYDSDTRSENKDVKDFLNEYKVQVELTLIDKREKIYSIRRDLYPRGNKCIFNESYNRNDFWNELKKLLSNLSEPNPTFKQLIPRFVKLENTAEDKMIKYLSMVTTSDDYDAIRNFLFQIHTEELISRKDGPAGRITECQKTIRALGRSESITSLGLLKQSLEVIDSDLANLYKKRQQLSYIDSYRDKSNTKRKLTVRIDDLQEEMQLADFEIEDIDESTENPSKEERDIDFGTLKAIYMEAQNYAPDLQKNFEEMVDFHDSMMQDRISFTKVRLYTKQELLEQYSRQLSEILKEEGKITIEVLNEELLDELNMPNRKIEELSLKKGETQQSIHLLKEQEQIRQNLNNKLSDIEKQMNDEKVEDRIKTFNQIFPDHCQRLYGEKYLLIYNESWREEKKFPVSTASLGREVGTGKKKAIIVAYNLTYMQYSIELEMNVPQFVIHDKTGNTHINRLRTIFEICEDVKGQYIVPVPRERIDKVEQKYIERTKILELSSSDKFFGI